jgi:uncharacterized protein YjbJ (UPF0337 family)
LYRAQLAKAFCARILLCAFEHRNGVRGTAFFPRQLATLKNTKQKRSAAMNWDRVEGNWTQFKGKVQEQWGNLTNDDLDKIEGNRKQLAGSIQERYGLAKDQAEKDIDTWLNKLN